MVLFTAVPQSLAMSLESAASTAADFTEATGEVAMLGANITMAVSEVAITVMSHEFHYLVYEAFCTQGYVGTRSFSQTSTTRPARRTPLGM